MQADGSIFTIGGVPAKNSYLVFRRPIFFFAGLIQSNANVAKTNFAKKRCKKICRRLIHLSKLIQASKIKEIISA